MKKIYGVQFLNWKALLVLSILFLSLSDTINAQYASCGRESWAWPGHNNWFWPVARPANGINYVLDQRAGVLNPVQNPAHSGGSWGPGNITAYQGCATASNDKGQLLFFSNGRSAFRANGTLITDGLLAGDECGSQPEVTSAVHGTMIVRHPLQPSLYYIVTIDDVVSQGNVTSASSPGTCGNGITYAIIDSSTNLVHNSIPIESNISSGKQGMLRTTEGFAATFHGNGVDIWLTFHPLYSTHTVSYLLTCEGFVTPPVVSNNGMVPSLNIAEGVGDIDFSPDGSKIAIGCETGLPNAYGTINLYDFDNWTGEISGRKKIYPSQWTSQNMYNLLFSSDGNELHFQGTGKAGKLDITSGNAAAIRAQGFITSPFLSNGFEAATLDYTGKIQPYDKTKYTETASAMGSVFSANDMYIPPQEEPDITPVGPFCDTASAIDLETIWRCSGVDAELAIKPDLNSPTDNDGFGYFGTGIATDDSSRIKGIFDPVAAGIGIHMIEFRFCGVEDTIWIEVVFCPACKANLQDVQPTICAGNEIRLDTMILKGTQTRTWTIDSLPSYGSSFASLNIGGGDTIFNALNNNIKAGTYKLKMQAEYNGDLCYDTMYITVDSLPIPVLEDSTICSDWEAVTLNPGVYDDYAWLPGGEIDPTIDVTVADDYSVTVTDANGCQGDTMMTFTVNDLPIAVLPNDTAICDGDLAITFSATASTGGSGSLITSYTWEDGDNSDSKTTDVAGEYWVAIEDANMCRDTDSVVLTVHALPVVDLRNDTSICAGDEALTIEALNPQANDSIYTWNTGEIAPSIDRDTAGIYKVVLTDKNGCLDSAEFELTINVLPEITLRDSTICSDAPNVVWDAAAATPGMIVYQWVNFADLSPVGAGAILDTKTAGEYIIGIVDAKQCIGADTIELIVNNFVPVDLGPDTAICADADDVVLDAGIANCNWYLWTPDNTTPTDVKTYSVNTEAMYRVELEDENGCKGEDSIYVTVNALPIVDLGPDTAICVGDPVVVFDAQNAGVGMKYLWGPAGELTQQLSTDLDGEYTVIIEDVNGCSDSDTVVLTVNALPAPDLGANQEICQAEDSVIFDAGYPTALSWVWDHGPTTQVIKAHFDPGVTASDETYTVTVTDENGCVKDTFATLTVNPMPAVSIRDSSVCADAPDVVFDIGATFDTYAWSNGGSGQTEAHSAAGVYTVTFTTAAGCEGTDEFELIRTPLPTPDLGADQTICAAASEVTFDAGPYTEYSWSSGEGSQTISTKVADTYELEVTDGNGCKATDEVVLIVIEMPDPAILSPATKCPGSSHTFDVTAFDNGNGPFTYTWQDGAGGSTYPTTAEGTVWVDITDKYGCTGRDEGSVIDKSDLTVLINDGNPIDLCEDEDVLLIPNYKSADGYNFTWSNAGSGTNETLTAAATGLYELHVDNGGGCKGDGSIQVTIHPDPILVSSVAGICDGEAALIGGDNDLGGTYTYGWNTGDGNATISVLTAGTYTQTVTSNMGCVSSETVVVDVYSNPVPNLGVDITVCTGVPVTFQDGSGTSNLTYAWSNGSNDPTISPTTDGTYTLTVTTPQSCTGTDAVDLTFIPIPTVDAGADKNLCEGESALIDPTISISGLAVIWNSGETTEDITVNQTFTHIIQVSDNGCTSSDTVDVVVVPLPTSTLNQALAEEPFCFEEDDRGIAIDAGGNPAYTYLWSTGETTSNINVDIEGTYIVNISVGNCEITDNITFKAYCPSTIFVPNAFTPDGNGINDSFNAQGYNLEDYEMYIYNRWGQLVYKSTSMFIDWDGTFMGNECQIDVYVWKIYYSVESTDGSGQRIKEQKVGRVSLMR